MRARIRAIALAGVPMIAALVVIGGNRWVGS
jgi:hypothetical protein